MRRRDRTKLRAETRQFANETRETADKLARMYGGVDDPDWPPAFAYRKAFYADTYDFVEQVCRPIARSTDPAEVQDALAAYRRESPRFICQALVQALDALESLV